MRQKGNKNGDKIIQYMIWMVLAMKSCISDLSLSLSLSLSDVVRLERPDLEQQRNELIVNINAAKNELKVQEYIMYIELIFIVLYLSF